MASEGCARRGGSQEQLELGDPRREEPAAGQPLGGAVTAALSPHGRCTSLLPLPRTLVPRPLTLPLPRNSNGSGSDNSNC